MKILNLLDFYGQPIKVYLNKESSVQTTLGGVLTIINFILIFIFSWYTGNDLFYKRKPFFYQHSLTRDNFSEILVNYSSFPIGFNLYDINGTILNWDNYIDLKFSYKQIEIDSSGVMLLTDEQQIKYKKCKYENFPIMDPQNFEKLGMSLALCPENYNFSLQGFWNENYLNYMSIEISKCNYQNNINGCKSKKEIDEFISLNGVNLALYLVDHKLSIMNYTYPFTFSMNLPFKFLDNQHKIIEMQIQKNSVFTDTGLIFESYEEQSLLAGVEVQSDTTLYDEKNKQLISFNFYSSNRSKQTYRKYIKFPDILASVGGMMKIINMLFFYLNYPFCQIQQMKNAINNFFESPFAKKQNSLVAKNFSNKKYFLNRTNSILCLQNIADNNINSLDFSFQKKVLESALKNKNENKLNIKLSCWDSFKIAFRKVWKIGNITDFFKESNILLYESGEDYLKKYFDMLKIIKNIKEVELLKKIILSDQQQKMFSLIKPFLEEGPSDESVPSPYNLIQDIHKINFQSEYDQKLFNYLVLNEK
jgi:hypothetical protein